MMLMDIFPKNEFTIMMVILVVDMVDSPLSVVILALLIPLPGDVEYVNTQNARKNMRT